MRMAKWALAGLLFSVTGTAFATPVSISTGVANWQVAFGTFATNGAVIYSNAEPSAAVESPLGSGYSTSTGDGLWVGPTTNSLLAPAGFYTYALNISSVVGASSGTYSLNFFSDDGVFAWSQSSGGSPSVVNGGGPTWTGTPGVVSGTFDATTVLFAVVRNDGAGPNEDQANPTGFVAWGNADATAVPLPASAWLLLTGLLALGVFSRRNSLGLTAS